jgi:hypothetical protein
LAEAVVAPGFDYETVRNVRVSVRVRTEEGRPLAGVGVTVLTEGGVRLAAGRTDGFGDWEQGLAVASFERRLVFRAATIGIPAEAVVDVAADMTVDFGS